jgi:hypothetical protein
MRAKSETPELFIIVNGISIARERIKLLFILYEAPAQKKTIYYVSGISGTPLYMVEELFSVWTAVDLLKVHKSKRCNYYNVDPEIIARIKKALENEAEVIENDKSSADQKKEIEE